MSPQTPANLAGRARLSKDGVFTVGEATRFMAPQYEGGFGFDQGLLIVPNFLTDADCAVLSEPLTDFYAHLRAPAADPFWDRRVVYRNHLLADGQSWRPATELMLAHDRRVRNLIRQTFLLDHQVYSDGSHLVRWPDGAWMPPHADHANPDGSPHGMAHREFAAVAYLNDDYAGGAIYFTALDLVLKPSAGTLVAYPADWLHEHAVLISRGAERLTLPSFYTSDPTKAERALYPELP